MLDMLHFVFPQSTDFDFLSLARKCFLPSCMFLHMFNQFNPLEYLVTEYEESRDPYEKTCLSAFFFMFVSMLKPYVR
jgi:hypothetical protein